MSNQQAVIRTVDGEIDEVFIENVDMHLEKMDRDEWSLILYRGDERVAFSIGLDTVNVPVPRLRDGALMIVVNVTLNDDEIGCEREEQGE